MWPNKVTYTLIIRNRLSYEGGPKQVKLAPIFLIRWGGQVGQVQVQVYRSTPTFIKLFASQVVLMRRCGQVLTTISMLNRVFHHRDQVALLSIK
jgi:hypothetical protein